MSDAEHTNEEVREGKPEDGGNGGGNAKGKPSPAFLVIGALLIIGGLVLGIWSLVTDGEEADANQSANVNVATPNKANTPPTNEARGTKVYVFDNQKLPIKGAEVLADGVIYPINDEGFALVAEEANEFLITAKGYFGQRLTKAGLPALSCALTKPRTLEIPAPESLELAGFPVSVHIFRIEHPGLLHPQTNVEMPQDYQRVLRFGEDNVLRIDDLPPYEVLAWKVVGFPSHKVREGKFSSGEEPRFSAEDFPRNATYAELTVDGITDPVGTWTIDAPAALTCEILGDTLIVAGEEGSFDVDLTFTDQAKRIARAYTSLMIREGELTRSDAIVAEATLGIAGKVVRGNQGQNAVLVSLRIGQTIHQTHSSVDGTFLITDIDRSMLKSAGFSARVEVRTPSGTIGQDVTQVVRDGELLVLDLDQLANSTLTVNIEGGVAGIRYLVASTKSSPFTTLNGDLAGNATIKLLPGDYTLWLWRSAFRGDTKVEEAFVATVHLDEGGSQSIDARFEPATFVEPSLGASGVESASVEVRNDKGQRTGLMPVLLNNKGPQTGEKGWFLPASFQGTLLFVTPGANRQVSFTVQASEKPENAQVVVLE